jgi:hypothetical protein
VAPFESRIALLSRIAQGYPHVMLRIVLAFAVTLYALLAAWFYHLVASATCSSGCYLDMRGIFLAPIPFVGAATTLLAAGIVVARRVPH